jgi:hypothetical protein
VRTSGCRSPTCTWPVPVSERRGDPRQQARRRAGAAGAGAALPRELEWSPEQISAQLRRDRPGYQPGRARTLGRATSSSASAGCQRSAPSSSAPPVRPACAPAARPQRRSRPRRLDRHAAHLARTAPSKPDLGPGSEMGRHATSPSPASCGLLLRPGRSLAARVEREHQRAAPPVPANGSDLREHTPDDLATIARLLNSRPRTTLGWDAAAQRVADLFVQLAVKPCCDDSMSPADRRAPSAL